MNTFSSEGFDLDAAAATAAAEGNNGDVIFEVGGGVTVIPKEEDGIPAPKSVEFPATKNDDPLFQAEEFKAQGNNEFKKGAYLEAYDLYTNAIEAVCPDSLLGDEILRLRDAFNEKEREKAIARHRISEERRRRSERENPRGQTTPATTTAADHRSSSSASSTGSDELEATKPDEFRLDPLPQHSETLAIYYCNRAACLLHLGRYDEALLDCDVAALLNPKYVKAYIRRSTAYEKTERTEEALRDAKSALGLDPSNVSVRQRVAYLQKVEDDRLEKLKTETFDKLKELGNSLLGNFGLSLDNFKAVQDPSTGSYSISFEQNK